MRLIAILGALALSACAPSVVVVVTATPLPPSPVVIVITATPLPASLTPAPSKTPEPTPTREVINPHAACIASKPIEDCASNANPYLEAPYSTRAIDGRIVQAPVDWAVIRDGGLPSWPNVTCAGGDCTISADSLSGRIGLRSGGTMVYADQRYLIVARYSVQCNSPQASRDTIRPYVRLHTSGPAGTTTTPEGALQRAAGYNESLWVVETSKRLSDVVIELWLHIPFGICGQNSTITLHSIELLPVPPDYGGDSVIRF